MPKAEWGTKRVCPTTGKRFYDLNANPIISPYTGQVVEIDQGKTRTMVADKADKNSRNADDTMDDDLLDDDDDLLDDDDDSVDLDDDVLEDEDDDDVSLDDIKDVAGDDED